MVTVVRPSTGDRTGGWIETFLRILMVVETLDW